MRYDRKSVQQWVEKAWAGEVTLADFQRSFVWDSGKATEYIKAILMGKPVGLFLILASADQPQFAPRAFNNIETPLDDVAWLVLDGQQRLTSLLHTLHGHPERRFFIKVADLRAETLEVEDVVCESKSARTGKTAKDLDTASTAFAKGLIPIDILRKTGTSTGMLSPLSMWCIEIGENVPGMQGNEARLLEDRIDKFVVRCFFQRELWYCLLPQKTNPKEAAQIFVATNTSSVKIKQFDIEVATARGSHGEDLRTEIQDAYDSSDKLRYYFSDDAEDYIPDIGEWMLKVACLHVNEPPKESSYSKAVNYLLDGSGATTTAGQRLRLNSVFRDLDWALARAEGFGAATDKMVPSRPVLHVLSALRGNVQKIGNPAKLRKAMRLLAAYYWRCLFSNRHSVQANDRLYEDYRQLLTALTTVGGELPTIAAFDNRDHQVFDKDHLMRHAGWIGSSRLGKALASAVMASEPKPREWMTDEVLSATEIRGLQGLRKLNRHHVFPKAALKGVVAEPLIQNALNGVVLDQRTNLRLWKVPPSEYVAKMLTELDVEDEELGERIEGHLVPYEELKSTDGKIQLRYDRYLKKRAEMMVEKIKQLTALP